MGKIFIVELSNGKDLYLELDLPATDYELLDAYECLQMSPCANPGLEITDYTDFQYLYVYLDNACSLRELNELSRRLDSMDQGQLAAFKGLCQIALQKREGPLTISDFLTYANSTDCCHVVPEALNDSQLGRFYAENGFIPEVEHIPDSVFELLDFEQLGRKARIAEKGIYTEHGYVMQHDELKQAPPIPEGPPPKPSYIFRLTLDNYPFDEKNHKPLRVPLDLPATEEELDAALEKLDAPSWEEVVIVDYDGALPDLEDAVDCFLGIDQLNELAVAVKQIMQDGDLTKLKAVLEVTKCTDLDDMVNIANQLDQYILERNHQSYNDIALSDLRVIAGEPALELLVPHVDLNGYGHAVAEKMNLTLSSYGAVSRRDGQPVQVLDSDSPQQGGMEVTM